MPLKYNYNVHCKTLQNLPKQGFLFWKYAIWQPCFLHAPIFEYFKALQWMPDCNHFNVRKSLQFSYFFQTIKYSCQKSNSFKSVQLHTYECMFVHMFVGTYMYMENNPM
jgi:hypothetical protein